MRPYILRAYVATVLDIAESKGYISHPWRGTITKKCEESWFIVYYWFHSSLWN